MLFLDLNKDSYVVFQSSRYVMSFRRIVMTSRPAASLCRVVVSLRPVETGVATRGETLPRVVSQVVSRHYVES